MRFHFVFSVRWLLTAFYYNILICNIYIYIYIVRLRACFCKTLYVHYRNTLLRNTCKTNTNKITFDYSGCCTRFFKWHNRYYFLVMSLQLFHSVHKRSHDIIDVDIMFFNISTIHPLWRCRVYIVASEHY